ncbi:NUDIX hydrolase [Cellulomonas fimi]|uniref:NUDIX hydrolase n=1 Tax=Cellulomonas fimi (strain ATCC 484 / DSM 20113 / JCM 1341 / CCUG 24087 / LMG 16345 / NBRC 15513 / NCIMB 8980 / NCTC 7547 / NRS-133) TaxID=590998 RepID=F4H0B8_CELFA|nr:NUDIX domain-containing protein [Cellulomonas fimi]AEE46165.1 NUDIX hydrolase [Cellulomonas fimi ATCC 484]VEH31894.1 RNA pyrophosphohydrolase [Cellulomonas fimi]
MSGPDRAAGAADASSSAALGVPGTTGVPPARGHADGGGPVHGLGPEWRPGPDGLLFRRAARVILLDEHDRVLLMRGHDVDQPERSWWFTVGGGIDDGEDSRTAALRELREETGIVLDPAALQGPVLTRSAIFDFFAQHCRQDEDLYLARVRSGDVGELSRDGWTELEAGVLDELRWWPLDELEAVDIEVFPAGLPALVRDLAAGWDGTVRHLGLARES